MLGGTVQRAGVDDARLADALVAAKLRLAVQDVVDLIRVEPIDLPLIAL